MKVSSNKYQEKEEKSLISMVCEKLVENRCLNLTETNAKPLRRGGWCVCSARRLQHRVEEGNEDFVNK